MFSVPENLHLNSSDLKKASACLAKYPVQHIACVNWPQAFPYKPQADFRMAHNGRELFIQFIVKEDCTMAKITQDGDRVYTDSCVEFFIALDESGYYNFEFSCIGKLLLGFRKERPHAIHASPEIMADIKRYSTLGEDNFDEKTLATAWELIVALPASSLFRHQIPSWQGVKARINLYKCGDHLSRPHYLSWQPIDSPKPDFHIPRCFARVQF